MSQDSPDEFGSSSRIAVYLWPSVCDTARLSSSNCTQEAVFRQLISHRSECFKKIEHFVLAEPHCFITSDLQLAEYFKKTPTNNMLISK
ncbi:hypothetical protein LSTR_LSTR006187 [Laodelphax striatellus]|uniref:Uncharacterized protein n=1 Tax=Laodelphax striatellus TaxID=195883 RepID=A0A482XRU1_LAOST|nr:hypothetical protein LSTR_LSTR006187 [Laodelphax striatellus]